MRLSRKAQELAGKLAAEFDLEVRREARKFAIIRGAEFADESDVRRATRKLILDKVSEELSV